jgi:hypothetical protein
LNKLEHEDMNNAHDNEAMKVAVRRHMRPPKRQSVARITEALGIHVVSLCSLKKAWRLERDMMPASEKKTLMGTGLPTRSRCCLRRLI